MIYANLAHYRYNIAYEIRNIFYYGMNEAKNLVTGIYQILEWMECKSSHFYYFLPIFTFFLVGKPQKLNNTGNTTVIYVGYKIRQICLPSVTFQFRYAGRYGTRVRVIVFKILNSKNIMTKVFHTVLYHTGTGPYHWFEEFYQKYGTGLFLAEYKNSTNAVSIVVYFFNRKNYFTI